MKNLRSIFFFSLLGGILLFTLNRCGEGTKKDVPPDSLNGKIKIAPVVRLAPEVNVDSIYANIEKQLSFGPRVPNTTAHENCAKWLEATFKRFTPNVIVQQTEITTHDKRVFHVKNIIAEFNPEKTKRVLVSSHWDSRMFADNDIDSTKHDEPVPAANDGASGVGIILEIARQLSVKLPNIGVDLILWDAEDHGAYKDFENSFCLGSQYWANHKHKPGYRPAYGINLDMVGADNARFAKEEGSVKSGESYVNNLWKVAGELGYGSFFKWENDRPIIDDHYYVIQSGIPMIELIDRKPDGGFFPYWHTTGDTIDKLSKTTLKAVGQTVIEVLFREI